MPKGSFMRKRDAVLLYLVLSAVWFVVYMMVVYPDSGRYTPLVVFMAAGVWVAYSLPLLIAVLIIRAASELARGWHFLLIPLVAQVFAFFLLTKFWWVPLSGFTAASFITLWCFFKPLSVKE